MEAQSIRIGIWPACLALVLLSAVLLAAMGLDAPARQPAAAPPIVEVPAYKLTLPEGWDRPKRPPETEEPL
jgi:hypothetical protein